jgi:hypothetical protein
MNIPTLRATIASSWRRALLPCDSGGPDHLQRARGDGSSMRRLLQLGRRSIAETTFGARSCAASAPEPGTARCCRTRPARILRAPLATGPGGPVSRAAIIRGGSRRRRKLGKILGLRAGLASRCRAVFRAGLSARSPSRQRFQEIDTRLSLSCTTAPADCRILLRWRRSCARPADGMLYTSML